MYAIQNPKDLSPTLVNQFKSVFKNYDLKLWKQCFKSCDTILKANPTHGETWALKGLVTHATGKKKEAIMLVKKGLRYDVKSSLSWDILSNIYRKDFLHYQGAKYSTLAHINLPQNEQIMKDLIAMHMQNREFNALLKISGDFLFSNKDEKQSKNKTIGYAFANYLGGEYKKAIMIIDTYLKSGESITADRFERSEVLFFKASAIEKSGDIQGALVYLKSVDDSITDRESLKLKRAYFYEKLEKKEDAQREWEELIATNPDNFSFHLSYLKVREILPSCHSSIFTPLRLDENKRDQLISIYDDFAKKYPRSKCCRQVPFPFLDGEIFKSKFTPFLCQAISKGEMTVIKCFKNLYADPTKVALIQEVLLNLKHLVENNLPFPGQTELEVPSSILIIKYILSQHYCKLKQHTEAMRYCEECIEHSPTVIDLYIQKGIILKDGGDAVAAAASVEEGRLLDLADRYLYTKATRFFLRADNIAQARIIESVYTKVESEVAANTVEEMQVTWYLQEEGESFMRQKLYGKALRRFHDIHNIYLEHCQDQMDFHFWCLRKATLRQYEELIALEDRMFGDKICRSAMNKIVQSYLEIHDNQGKAVVDGSSEKEKSTDTKKPKVDDKTKKPLVSTTTEKKPRKEDADGEKLVNLGLEEASLFVDRLIKFSSKHITTHLLAFEVSWRQKNYGKAVKALTSAFAIDSSNLDLHIQLITFFSQISTIRESLSSTTKETFEAEQTQIFNGKSIEEFNKNFFELHKSEVKGRFLYYKCSLLLGQKGDKTSLIDTTNYNLQDCLEVYKYLQESEKDIADEYKAKCHVLFPFAVYFKENSEIEAAVVVAQNEPASEKSEPVQAASGEKTG